MNFTAADAPDVATPAVSPDNQVGHWSRSRWMMWISLVFGAQVALIFVLGDSSPTTVRKAVTSPQLNLVTAADELLKLNNPTLFALPSENGFSGAAWMKWPIVEVAPYRWTEPTQWLPIPAGQLASGFFELVRTNAPTRFLPPLKSAPLLTMPKSPSQEVQIEVGSTFRLEGALSGRSLLNPPKLSAQPAGDLLANTIVQVMVDAAGRVLSAVLLPPGSGSKEADQTALNVARTMRLESLPAANPSSNDADNWTRGRMIFQWQTVPLPQTNAPASIP